MNNVRQVAVFLLQYPIPAPIILFILPIDFVLLTARSLQARCCKPAKAKRDETQHAEKRLRSRRALEERRALEDSATLDSAALRRFESKDETHDAAAAANERLQRWSQRPQRSSASERRDSTTSNSSSVSHRAKTVMRMVREQSLDAYWWDELAKRTGTRRFLMERAAGGMRPFMYEKRTVFTKSEVAISHDLDP